MSPDCPIEKIKAMTKANDKNMLRQIKLFYILKTTRSSWVNPFCKVNRGNASSSFPTCVSLSSPSISPSSLLTILDQGFPTLYPLLLLSWPGNGIDIGCVFKRHPSYLDELQQHALESVARFKTMSGNTSMVLASQLGLIPDGEWWL